MDLIDNKMDNNQQKLSSAEKSHRDLLNLVASTIVVLLIFGVFIYYYLSAAQVKVDANAHGGWASLGTVGAYIPAYIFGVIGFLLGFITMIYTKKKLFILSSFVYFVFLLYGSLINQLLESYFKNKYL